MSASLALAAAATLAAAALARERRGQGSRSWGERGWTSRPTLIGTNWSDRVSARERMRHLMREMKPTEQDLAFQFAEIEPRWLARWLRSYGEGHLVEGAPSAEELARDVESELDPSHALEMLTPKGVTAFNLAATDWAHRRGEKPPSVEFSNPKLLKDVWLIHHSRSGDLAQEGFRFGVPSPSHLAYTGGGHNFAGQEPGYNFAYLPADRDNYGIDRRGHATYGDYVYAFFVPWAIYAWHYGDKEPQVIFWGPSARNIVELKEQQVSTEDGLEDRWVVSGLDADGREGRTISAESASDLVDWLEDNWDQYRPVLGQELDRLRRRAQRGWSYEATGQREFRVPWSDEPRRQTVYTDVYRGPGKGTARHKKGW